jgi:hypothetical protein
MGVACFRVCRDFGGILWSRPCLRANRPTETIVHPSSRRNFLHTSVSSAAALALAPRFFASDAPPKPAFPVAHALRVERQRGWIRVDVTAELPSSSICF